MLGVVQSVRRVATAVAFAALVAATAAASASAEDLGPAVATKAPNIGTRLDQTGKPRMLADLMGQNGLVLMFFRSADWCPYCQAQLIEVNGGAAEIEKRG
jgi:thiol-disulfide isomerase/thioredoxin